MVQVHVPRGVGVQIPPWAPNVSFITFHFVRILKVNRINSMIYAVFCFLPSFTVFSYPPLLLSISPQYRFPYLQNGGSNLKKSFSSHYRIENEKPEDKTYCLHNGDALFMETTPNGSKPWSTKPWSDKQYIMLSNGSCSVVSYCRMQENGGKK